MHIIAVQNARVATRGRRSFVDPEMAERLRAARRAAGYDTAREVSKRHGNINYNTYIQHENGLNGFDRDAAKVYAKAFRVSPGWLLTGVADKGDSVPVVGIAGAGPDGAILFDLGDGNLGEAPSPPVKTPATVAVEVRGQSMRGIAEDGWLVYYDDRHDPPSDHMLGRLCVAGLADGRVLVKFLHKGTEPGRYHLESVAAPTLRDAEVAWAALVTAIVPR